MKTWLADLDFNSVCAWWSGKDNRRDPPRFVYDDPNGFAFEFIAVPRRTSSSSSRTISMQVGIGGKIDTFSPLRTALCEKANRYGHLGRPFVIAINAVDLFINSTTIEEVLFGRNSVEIFESRNVNRRLPDGMWGPESAGWAKRMSAVLFTRKLSAGSTFLDSEATLYLNPWCEFPYSGSLTTLATARLNSGVYVKLPGAHLTEILTFPVRPPGVI